MVAAAGTALQPAEGAATPKGSASHSTRRYEPEDYDQICDICSTVYGGTDFLPRVVNELSRKAGVLLLVAQSGSAPRTVDGIVCCEDRGDGIWYLFGLRVREGMRGLGLGTLLMQAARAAAAHSPVIVSTTIPENTGSLKVFARLHLRHWASVDIWPPWKVMQQYEAGLGWPAVQAEPDSPHMLDALPTVRRALEEHQQRFSSASAGAGASAAAAAASAQWEQCRSSAQLAAAVASIRGSLKAASAPFEAFFPFVYEVYGLNSAWMQQRFEAGQVWLLPRGSDGQAVAPSPCTSYGAAIVMYLSPTLRRVAVGAMVADEGALCEAISWAAAREKHFSMFIMRCFGGNAMAALSAVAESDLSATEQLPAVYAATSMDVAGVPAAGCDKYVIHGDVAAAANGFTSSS